MTEPVDASPDQLLKLVTVQMPFGKYEGRLLAELPGHYLNWFARTGFPRGELGRLLALMQTIDHNGLRYLLRPLAGAAPARTPPPAGHPKPGAVR